MSCKTVFLRRPARGDHAPAITGLALLIAGEAINQGFAVLKNSVPRIRSASRYLLLADKEGRNWLIRISDHASRKRQGRSRPHLDLVSDGSEGLDVARSWLRQVRKGRIKWHDPQGEIPPAKRKKRKARAARTKEPN